MGSRNAARRRRQRNKRIKAKKSYDVQVQSELNAINQTSPGQETYTIFMHRRYDQNDIKYYDGQIMKSFNSMNTAIVELIRILYQNITIKKKIPWPYDKRKMGTYVAVTEYNHKIYGNTYVGIVTNQTINHALLTENIIHTLRDGICMWWTGYNDKVYKNKYFETKKPYPKEPQKKNWLFRKEKKLAKYKKNMEIYKKEIQVYNEYNKTFHAPRQVLFRCQHSTANKWLNHLFSSTIPIDHFGGKYLIDEKYKIFANSIIKSIMKEVMKEDKPPPYQAIHNSESYSNEYYSDSS